MNAAPTVEHQLYMQTSEVAIRCGVATGTVLAWERSGRLPAIKTARGVRLFKADDVERLAAERDARQHAGAA